MLPRRAVDRLGGGLISRRPNVRQGRAVDERGLL
jgi:hypothetical protein